MYQQQLHQAQAEYQQLCQDATALNVCATGPGRVTHAELLKMPGQYVGKGDVLATVSSGDWIVKTIVTAEDVCDAQPKPGQSVEVCLPGQADYPLQGTILRAAKAGSRQIQDQSLTHAGGGNIPVNGEAQEALHPFFEFTVVLDDTQDRPIRHGMTATIRLNSTPVPISKYLLRRGLKLLNEIRIAS